MLERRQDFLSCFCFVSRLRGCKNNHWLGFVGGNAGIPPPPPRVSENSTANRLWPSGPPPPLPPKQIVLTVTADHEHCERDFESNLLKTGSSWQARVGKQQEPFSVKPLCPRRRSGVKHITASVKKRPLSRPGIPVTLRVWYRVHPRAE